jgi:hypothetical protein
MRKKRNLTRQRQEKLKTAIWRRCMTHIGTMLFPVPYIPPQSARRNDKK